MVDRIGTAGNDEFGGMARDDRLSGLSGQDSISANGGADTVAGGEGADLVYGGAGGDLIFGFGASDSVAGSGDIMVEHIAAGLHQPLFATSAPGEPNRLFVVGKQGVIHTVDLTTGTVDPEPFLTIPPGDINASGLNGLFGLAFHPDYATNGRFFVYLKNEDRRLEVREYSRSADDPSVADPDTRNTILTTANPVVSPHNGGWIAFGPDGYLYIATGDGGGANDPANNAQNPRSFLGKILRIDVDGDDFGGDAGRDYAIPDDNPFRGADAAGEIWALGLRNPWRASFDRLTGDLYIGDVGQYAREEINFQPAGSAGGQNYGWVIREGMLVNDPDRPGNLPPDSSLLIDPIHDYPHTIDENGGLAVTGGYVYRGTGPGMQGVYFFADYATDNLWSFRVVDGRVVDLDNRTDQLAGFPGRLDAIVSFGEDGHGNLYVVSIRGDVYRLTPGIGAGDGGDRLYGGAGRDTIHGGAGADTLKGDLDDDRLFGGSQDDRIVGGLGRDRLAGGAGADAFVFDVVAESPVGPRRDVILDFQIGLDVIDLSLIDAAAGQVDDQAFVFIAGATFTAEGQIRAVQTGADTLLYVNQAGTGLAEMAILLKGVRAGDLSEDSFIL